MNSGKLPDVIIRRARLDDISRVSKLCSAHATYERSQFDPKGHQQRLAKAIDGVDPRLTIFIAESQGAVVGYASVSREYSTWAADEYMHMDCLFVQASMRGRNIGKLIFAGVLKEACRLGIMRVEWQTPDWNSDAIGFYRSLGGVDKAKARFSINPRSISQLP